MLYILQSWHHGVQYTNSRFIPTSIGMTSLKGNYHYYCGEDISKFHYPDEELLEIGQSIFCTANLNCKLLGRGLTAAEQIADKIIP